MINVNRKAFRKFVKQIKADEPGMGTTEKNDALHDLVARASRGWLIMLGNPDRVAPIEQEVYTPGTPKNADLDVMLMRQPFVNHAWLARKNEALAACLQIEFGPSSTGFAAWQVVIFDPPAFHFVPPGTLYRSPDGTAIALAGAEDKALEIFLFAYLKVTRYRPGQE